MWPGYSTEPVLLYELNSRYWDMALSSFWTALHVTFSSDTEYLMTSQRDAQLIIYLFLKGVLGY